MNSKALRIDGFGFGEWGSADELKFGWYKKFLLMNGIEAKTINTETMKETNLGEEGLLCFTGPTVSTGYYNNEETTKNSFGSCTCQKKYAQWALHTFEFISMFYILLSVILLIFLFFYVTVLYWPSFSILVIRQVMH